MQGRPTDYTEEKADEICNHIAEGNSLASYCRVEGNAKYSTIMQWLVKHESFAEKYTRAREEQGEADADAVSDIRMKVMSGELDPQAARVAMDAAKWTAAKRKPKKYGEKLELEHSGSVSLTPDARQAEIERLLAKRSDNAADGS